MTQKRSIKKSLSFYVKNIFKKLLIKLEILLEFLSLNEILIDPFESKKNLRYSWEEMSVRQKHFMRYFDF